jgi:RNA polymerase-binding transcription factor DksA
MDRGEYGVCEVCGEPIKIERLKVYPEAETCVKHAKEE